MSRERDDSDGYNSGYDSSLLWSDDPENAYFRAMIKEKKAVRAANGFDTGDSLMGDSTLASFLEDWTVSTSEQRAEGIGSGLSWGPDGSSSIGDKRSRLGGMGKAERSEGSGISDSYGFPLTRTHTFPASNVTAQSNPPLGILPIDPPAPRRPQHDEDGVSPSSKQAPVHNSPPRKDRQIPQYKGSDSLNSDAGKGPLTLASEMSAEKLSSKTKESPWNGRNLSKTSNPEKGLKTGEMKYRSTIQLSTQHSPSGKKKSGKGKSENNKPPRYERGDSLNSDTGKGPLTLRSEDSYGFVTSKSLLSGNWQGAHIDGNRSLSPGNKHGSDRDEREVIDPNRLTRNANEKEVYLDGSVTRSHTKLTSSQDSNEYNQQGPVGQIGFSANPPSVMESTLSNPSAPRVAQLPVSEELPATSAGESAVNPPGFIYLSGNSLSSARHTGTRKKRKKKVSEQRRHRPRSVYLKITLTIFLLAVVVAIVLLSLVLKKSEKSESRAANSFPTPPPSLTFPPVWKVTPNPTLNPSVSPISRPTQNPTTPEPTYFGWTASPTNQQSQNPSLTPSISSPFPTQRSSQVPSTRNTQQVFDEAVSRILIYSPDSATAIADSNSAQSQALNWMVNNDVTILNFSDFLLVQRWAISTIYYSLGGSQWFNFETRRFLPNSWLSLNHECEWHQIACNGQRKVTSVDLNQMNLSGSLPRELYLLKSLTSLRLDNNAIAGTILTELGLLSDLKVLQLNGNAFVGSIPSQIGNIVGLEYLDLSHNSFSGTIPQGIEILPLLGSLFVERNDIGGTMPTNLCGKAPRIQLSADCEEITCTCCTYCCVDGLECIGMLFIASGSPSQVPTAGIGGSITTLSPSIAVTSSSPSITGSTSPSVVSSQGPTLNPTTSLPSSKPSLRPTLRASLAPSSEPSLDPTQVHSQSPTVQSTLSPTHLPTVSPTLVPSPVPSGSPSSEPTDVPTLALQPSSPPTRNQSQTPTNSPIKLPTRTPTQDPTRNPTKAPTQNPTRNPTRNPSTQPS